MNDCVKPGDMVTRCTPTCPHCCALCSQTTRGCHVRTPWLFTRATRPLPREVVVWFQSSILCTVSTCDRQLLACIVSESLTTIESLLPVGGSGYRILSADFLCFLRR